MMDKTDSEEFGLGFGFIEDEPDEDCDCCVLPDGRPPLPLKVAKPRFEVEIEFDENVGETDDIVSGMYLDNVDTIYIENEELRLVDGPIAQVISLDDIRFLRANIR